MFSCCLFSCCCDSDDLDGASRLLLGSVETRDIEVRCLDDREQLTEGEKAKSLIIKVQKPDGESKNIVANKDTTIRELKRCMQGQDHDPAVLSMKMFVAGEEDRLDDNVSVGSLFKPKGDKNVISTGKEAIDLSLFLLLSDGLSNEEVIASFNSADTIPGIHIAVCKLFLFMRENGNGLGNDTFANQIKEIFETKIGCLNCHILLHGTGKASRNSCETFAHKVWQEEFIPIVSINPIITNRDPKFLLSIMLDKWCGVYVRQGFNTSSCELSKNTLTLFSSPSYAGRNTISMLDSRGFNLLEFQQRLSNIPLGVESIYEIRQHIDALEDVQAARHVLVVASNLVRTHPNN